METNVWTSYLWQQLTTAVMHRGVTSDLNMYKLIAFQFPCRYTVLDMNSLIRANCKKLSDVATLVSALRILKKYGTNLLQPQRPTGWETIHLSNSVFKNQVDIINGARLLLMAFGYNVITATSMQFPPGGRPNINTVSTVTAEVVVARFELECFCADRHPFQLQFANWMNLEDEQDRLIGTLLKPKLPLVDGLPASFQLVPDEAPQTLSPECEIYGDTTQLDGGICDICGERPPEWHCDVCDGNLLCKDCDILWHSHPRRTHHQRDCIVNNGEHFSTPPGELILLHQEDEEEEEGSDASRSTGSEELVADDDDDGASFVSAVLPPEEVHQLNVAVLQFDPLLQAKKTARDGDSGYLASLLAEFSNECPFSAESGQKMAIAKGEVKEDDASCVLRSETDGERMADMLDVENQDSEEVVVSSIHEEPNTVRKMQLEVSETGVDAEGQCNAANSQDSEEPSTVRMMQLEDSESGVDAEEPCNVDNRQPVDEKVTDCHQKLVSEVVPETSLPHQQPGASAEAISSEMGGILVHEASASHDRISKKKATKTQFEKQRRKLAVQGLSKVNLCRKAERHGFSVPELVVALELACTANPIEWLNTEWRKLIRETRGSTWSGKDGLGRVSSAELRACMRACGGKASNALQLCVQQRNEHLALLKKTEDCSHQEAVTALDKSEGDLEGALQVIQRKKCYTMARNIQWEKSPEELELRIRNKDIVFERRVRMLLAERLVPDYSSAINAVCILDGDDLEGHVTFDDVIEAVSTCNGIAHSLRYLQQECQVCFSCFPASQISTLLLCTCRICVSCLRAYLELHVRERPIRAFVCPTCSQPDPTSVHAMEDHVQFLAEKIKFMMSQEVHQLFQNKLVNWHLENDKNFVWCPYEDCVTGFLSRGEENQIECPHCIRRICRLCKKPWEAQHDGISCEQFAHWKHSNEAEYQQKGLAQYLQVNGIVCPKCKSRYALAKGGCLHFTCHSCKHEFCCGCRKPFISNCGQCYNKKMGLHCHHPRDCLFYLRDWDVKLLKRLLNTSDVDFDSDPPLYQTENATCPVMVQVELTHSFVDQACGAPVPNSYPGLCDVHYSEYLVSLINKHRIDPVAMMSVDNLKHQLEKEGYRCPVARQGENEQQYAEKLRMLIKEWMPLCHNDRAMVTF